MRRRKLKRIKFIKDCCSVSGVVGFLILATIPDDLPVEIFAIRVLIAMSVMALSYITHRFMSGLERYKKSTRERQFHMYSLKNTTQE